MKILYPLKDISQTPGVYLTQKFGETLLDYSHFGLKFHNGIDWAAPKGTPVYAVHDGNIQFITENENYGTGYGKNIRLYFDEEGYTWDCVYGHLDRYEGLPRAVKAGEIIGYVDSTGFSTGNHLHFGIRRAKNGAIENYNNGVFGYFDPAPYFGKEFMQLIRDKGTIYLVSGINDKRKIGIADLESLDRIFGDEPIIDGDTSNVEESFTMTADGIVIHKKPQIV